MANFQALDLDPDVTVGAEIPLEELSPPQPKDWMFEWVIDPKWIIPGSVIHRISS